MKTKSQFFSIVFCFSIFFILVSCRQQKAKWHGTIKEKDGITVVKNPKGPMYDEDVFVIEEELAITSQSREEEFIFQYTPNLVVDEEENIYVLDTAAAHIIVFDKNGNYLKTFGNKGQGPGELGHPLDIQIFPGRELMISDLTQFRLDFFSLSGEFLHDISTGQMLNFRRPVVDSKGNIIAGFWNYGDEYEYILKKFNSDLSPIHTVTVQPTLTQPGISEHFEMTRATNLTWNVTVHDEIIWGIMTRYEILVHDPDGKLVKKIVRKHEKHEITKEEKKMLTGGEPIPSYYKVPDRYPAFIRFTCDEEGRIFVQTYDKTEDGEADYYDVFDSEGKYIARISLKYRPQTWKNKRLYTMEEDEDGYQVVKRYKVTWKI